MALCFIMTSLWGYKQTTSEPSFPSQIYFRPSFDTLFTTYCGPTEEDPKNKASSSSATEAAAAETMMLVSLAITIKTNEKTFLQLITFRD